MQHHFSCEWSIHFTFDTTLLSLEFLSGFPCLMVEETYEIKSSKVLRKSHHIDNVKKDGIISWLTIEISVSETTNMLLMSQQQNLPVVWNYEITKNVQGVHSVTF